jgi:hypothetical protein
LKLQVIQPDLLVFLLSDPCLLKSVKGLLLEWLDLTLNFLE